MDIHGPDRAVADAAAARRTATPSAHSAAGPRLSAGVGQADITPQQTGYFLGGWTLAYRLALGQSTRLYANALVLRRGGKKLALVQADLFAVTAGMQSDVASRLASLGFSRANILLQASHTHSGPSGWTNNPAYNTAAPDATPGYVITNPSAVAKFFTESPADVQLYTFSSTESPSRSVAPTPTYSRPRRDGATPSSSASRRTAASRPTWPTSE